MADAVLQLVSPLLQVVFENLNTQIQSEFNLVWGVKKDMKKLSNTLSTIQDVLEDAEMKQFKEKAIRNWLRKLKDAAYEAEDVLDEWATEELQLKSESRYQSSSTQVNQSCLSCFHFEQITFHHRMGKRIKEIREKFDEIAAEKSKFVLGVGVVDRKVELSGSRETSSTINEREVYGRDEEKKIVIDQLLKTASCEENLSIFPILGIGGIGKTTLAQLVYNHKEVETHFEIRSWVCVSEDFYVKRLIKAIIQSLGKDVGELVDLDPMERRLRDVLNGKKFLLVLDDVWNANQMEWNRLKHSLMCGAKGSTIIVTTRLEKVALIMGTLLPHHLTGISDDNCWSLFRQYAFGNGREERPNLIKIGKEIVNKCRGVPLAAKALGSLMSFKKEEIEWVVVRDSKIWHLPEDEGNDILPALRLSYNHLPSHLRQCFAYCSIFPKDYEMKRKELIHLWMANGFIRSRNGMELEDIGNEILNDLVWLSLFQDITKDDDGNIKTCKMHDLLHDLACSVMANECHFVEDGRTVNLPRTIRHLSLNFHSLSSSSSSSSSSSINLECLLKPQPSMRSLLLLHSSSSYGQIPITLGPQFISNHKCLRVLDLRRAEITTLPLFIGNLKHLRYLNLSSSSITSLPESICSLRNLQTLELSCCDKLEMLPKNMRKMNSLRHLDILGCESLTYMPSEIGQMTSLRTLNMFIVSPDSGCGIGELQGLNLIGEIEIKGVEHVRNLVDAKDANLKRKENLCSLSLYWSGGVDADLQGVNSEWVLEALQPHPNIKKMFINGYPGVKFPSWMGVSSSLEKLVEISLKECKRFEQFPPLGQLPLLKYIFISRMDSVKRIGEEFYGEGLVKGFPSLEELDIKDMPNLEDWWWRQNRREEVLFPCLRNLTIRNCPKLKTFPLPLSVEILELNRCNEMILRSLEVELLHCHLSFLHILDFGELISFPEGMLRNLTALKTLNIQLCVMLKTLPMELENLTSLSELKLVYCMDLDSLPEGLQNLTSLKSLNIGHCDGLKSLPKVGIQGLSSLELLEIEGCGSLTSMSDWLRYLTSLQKLVIEGCPELEFSPEDFQHLTALRDLQIDEFPKLTSLPEGLQYVTTLQHLSIYNCENLTFLPEGVQLLTDLQTLRIVDCSPHLHRRCEKVDGEDWYKIAHIPQVITYCRR